MKKRQPASTVPQLKINKFQSILDKPKVDEFGPKYFHSDTRSHGGSVMLTVHEDDTGKYFIIHGGFQVYGWTTDADKAFQAWGNLCVYTSDEFYTLCRGRMIPVAIELTTPDWAKG